MLIQLPNGTWVEHSKVTLIESQPSSEGIKPGVRIVVEAGNTNLSQWNPCTDDKEAALVRDYLAKEVIYQTEMQEERERNKSKI